MSDDIARIFTQQQHFFNSNQTRSVSFRKQQLHLLQQALTQFETPLLAALEQDLGKSAFESYATEIGFCFRSIKTALKQLPRWQKTRKVRTNPTLFSAKSTIFHDPYGVVLIIGPFNYPVQLLLEPLIGAIAAGNCTILKASELTPHVSSVLAQLIVATFPPDYITLIEGDAPVTTTLLTQPFDYIFFTGSITVGKIVYEAAAQKLIPVTLELGGKSPAIVHSDAKIKNAAERIVWGKFLNTGQTCIAPDYILVHKSQEAALIKALKQTITAFYGTTASESPDYGRIVNKRHFNRLISLLEHDRDAIISGGHFSEADLFIEPTLLQLKNTSAATMQEELFGPLLPIITYNELHEAKKIVAEHPTPLALYLFTESKVVCDDVFTTITFGGGCVNDTISHVANETLPFGGVGTSGIGAYHGEASFTTFSHQKSRLKRRANIRVSFLFPPYKNKLKWLRKIL